MKGFRGKIPLSRGSYCRVPPNCRHSSPPTRRASPVMIGTLASLISTARAALNGMEGRSRARGSSKRPHAPEVSAPETPTQAIESSKRRRVADACPLLELPEELLERALLYSTTPRDLCAIAQCSTRLRTISDVRARERAFGRNSGPGLDHVFWGRPTVPALHDIALGRKYWSVRGADCQGRAWLVDGLCGASKFQPLMAIPQVHLPFDTHAHPAECRRILARRVC